MQPHALVSYIFGLLFFLVWYNYFNGISDGLFINRMSKSIILIAILSVPTIVFGQTLPALIAVAGDIAGLLVSLFSTFAFVAFFYGLAKFIFNSGDEKMRAEGKSWMFWSIIALFVLVTIWGIIGLLQRTVGNTVGPGKINIVIPTF